LQRFIAFFQTLHKTECKKAPVKEVMKRKNYVRGDITTPSKKKNPIPIIYKKIPSRQEVMPKV
jgi:hypothetical protein